MNKWLVAVITLPAIYIVFNITIGTALSRRVIEFDHRVERHESKDINRTLAVDSSLCNLLVERSNWRGWLQAAAYPLAAHRADELLANYRFVFVPNSFNPTHCGKYNNTLAVENRDNAR